MRLTQPLHKARREQPTAIATICSGRRRTHQEFVQRVARFAGALQLLGIRPGDRVAMLALNSARYLEYLYGCWWAGAAIAPVNIRWSVPEIVYSLDDCGASILLVDRHYAPMADEVREKCQALSTVIYADDDPAAAAITHYEALLAAAEPIPDAARGGEHLAAVLYTGGTTGKPKGVMLSHDNLAIDALATIAADPRGSEPVVLHSAPLFHVGGISFALQAAARQAVQVLIPAFDPAAALALVEQERVSELFLVPIMIKRLIEHPDFPKRDVSSLRTLVYGAAPIDSTLLDQAMRALPQVRFIQAYGQTEAAPVVSVLPAWRHTPEGRKNDKLASAGKPISTAETRIVDRDGAELPADQVGEICVRGPTVMQGYWNKAEQTAEALRDGWLHTGDGGYLDTDGYLYVVDRIRDMIITGGENVFSSEVENALLQHPQVSQCAVIGIPDDTWGERVHAFVVLRKGATVHEAALIAHCKTLIAGYKCPRSIEFRKDLPLSAAGKLLKYQLREPYWRGRKRSIG